MYSTELIRSGNVKWLTLFILVMYCGLMSSQEMVDYYWSGVTKVGDEELGYAYLEKTYDLELPCEVDAVTRAIRKDIMKSINADTSIMRKRKTYDKDYHIDKNRKINYKLEPSFWCVRKVGTKYGIFTAVLYYSSYGGAGTQGHEFMNYKMWNGKRLKLDDMFEDGYYEKFTSLLTSYRNHIEGITTSEINPTDNFYLMDSGIVFVYHKYEIACGARDEIRLKIKWEAIKNLLKIEWRCLAN